MEKGHQIRSRIKKKINRGKRFKGFSKTVKEKTLKSQILEFYDGYKIKVINLPLLHKIFYDIYFFLILRKK